MSNDTKPLIFENRAKEEDMPENDIPLEVLEAVHLDLPDEYLDEMLAAEMLNTILAYHSTQIQLKAHRHNEDGPAAEKARKLMMTLKTQAALIQHEHPATVAIYKELAIINAKARQQARANTLEA